jgi:hypothetical protein
VLSLLLPCFIFKNNFKDAHAGGTSIVICVNAGVDGIVHSKISRGVISMNMSSLNAPNRIPRFGGANSSAPHPAIIPEDESSHVDDSCPDEIFLHQIQTGYGSLPYRVFDDYDRGGGEGIKGELPVVYYENDVYKLTIDPAHGAKMLSVRYKPDGTELLFHNPVFQPGALARLNAWTRGGVEWNWPRLGHTVFTGIQPQNLRLDTATSLSYPFS